MAPNSASTASAAVSTTLNAVRRAMKPYSHRSISVSVSPAPINFAERRSVLQVLQRYGPVEFFKAVPGHDSMFISLMKDEAAVSQLITKSPISFNVFVPQNAPESLLSSLNGSQALSKSKPITAIKDALPSSADTPSSSTSQDAVSGSDLPQKEFQIQIWPHPTYRHHESYTTKLHLSWPEYVCKNESFVTRMLKDSLPNTMATKGLAHWNPDFGQQRMASDNYAKEQDRKRVHSWIPGKLQARLQGQKEAQSSAEEAVTAHTATDESQRIPSLPFSSWSG
ncbi:hypothetical protein B0T10DRAFT_554425 [Thelonectria olida]|uniref:Pal1-like protein n=1 Tax=Thelonectria olida TaxID=1576542 RepID=A0A9P8WLB1_9HYPO|nr:hypothetical protein B0T10DRAFT_554425 [Thelonectria olida]